MKKVAVIDDSVVTRLFIKKELSIYDVEVIEGSNGNEALLILEREKPDLLILDLLMPEKDGLTVLSEMKQLQIQVPVLVVSADIQSPVKKKCKELGAIAFLHKPIDTVKFNRAVSSYFI